LPTNTHPWFVSIDGNRIGPIEFDNVVQILQANSRESQIMVWREGMECWCSPIEVPELNHENILGSSTAPKTPPPLPSESQSPSSPDSFGAGSASNSSAWSMGGVKKSLLGQVDRLRNIAPNSLPFQSKSADSSTASPVESTPRDALTMQPATIDEPPLSPTALAVRKLLGEETWTALRSAGLLPTANLACLPILRLRFNEEGNSSPSANAMSLLRRVSNKISDLTDRGDLVGHHYLIDVGEEYFFIASKIVGKPEIYKLPRKSLAVKNRWSDETLEIELYISDPAQRIKSVLCRLTAAESYPESMIGSLLPLLRSADDGACEHGRDALPTLLRSRVSSSKKNTFSSTFNLPPKIVIVEVQENTIKLTDAGKTESIALNQILAWNFTNGAMSLLVCSPTQLRRIILSKWGVISKEETEPLLPTTAEPTSLPSPENTKVVAGLPPQSSEENSKQSSQPNTDRSESSVSAEIALNKIAEHLRLHIAERQSNIFMCAADLEVASLTQPTTSRVVIVLRDAECEVSLCGDNSSELRQILNPRMYLFGDMQALQTDSECYYRVNLLESEKELWKSLVLKETLASTIDHSLVCLSVNVQGSNLEPKKISWEATRPYRLERVDDAIRLIALSIQQDKPDTIGLDLKQISDRSLVWKETFGAVAIDIESSSPKPTLIADNRTLIQLWELKELRALTIRTTKVPLGTLYQEYFNSRCEKYLAGVFGNFFIAQQHLERQTTVESLIQDVLSAPPGPLTDDLRERLIERLSILEVARHQLSRWLDRCVLMYPHYMAQCEREWLNDVMGEKIVDRSVQEKEAWRVHQQLRGELRQVQASMSKALGELGHNLHAISWIFPEEVRCAALAGLRRTAGLAEKGAMLAVFGGIGGQLLMGLGRASIGDPLGFAMVGALGLSLVGRQLDNSVKEKEKQLRLRAYGIQALQWWDTTLETAAVMALECRRSMQLNAQYAMQRDRQLLEKLPTDELPKVQMRMASAMKRALHQDVSSQFYEAVPGSGLFGWHLVDHITQLSIKRSGFALRRFHEELPGAMALSKNT
jgi:hypothetical protein